MATLKLSIITPEAVTFSDDVDSVVIPADEGEMGILPHHVPVMAKLRPGELRYRKGNEERYLAVGKGFVEVLPASVSVLAESAMYEADIDEAAVEAAIERARKALSDQPGDDETAALEALVMANMAALEVKRRRRKGA